MIRKIKNNGFIDLKNVNKAGNYNRKSLLPSKNSLVLIKILDRIGKNYKILVNGKLFQTDLAMNLNNNDEMIAKVISQKPLKLLLAELQSHKTKENIAEILSLLGLEEGEKNKSLIKELISRNKPLVKEKINDLSAFIQSRSNLPDPTLFALLIEVFWKFHGNERNYLLRELDSIFDISFNELAKRIADYISLLNKLYPKEDFTNEMNSIFVLNKEGIDTKNLFPFMDKSSKLTDLINSNEFSVLSSSEKITGEQLFIKYILQKSLFSYFNIFPEMLVHQKIKYEGLVFNFERTVKNHEPCTIIKVDFKLGSSEVNFVGLLSNLNLYAEIFHDKNFGNMSWEKVANLNHFINNNLFENSKILLKPRKNRKSIDNSTDVSTINHMA